MKKSSVIILQSRVLTNPSFWNMELEVNLFSLHYYGVLKLKPLFVYIVLFFWVNNRTRSNSSVLITTYKTLELVFFSKLWKSNYYFVPKWLYRFNECFHLRRELTCSDCFLPILFWMMMKEKYPFSRSIRALKELVLFRLSRLISWIGNELGQQY